MLFCAEELIPQDPILLLKKLDQGKLLKKLKKSYPGDYEKVIELIKKGDLKESLEQLQPLFPYSKSKLPNSNFLLHEPDEKEVLKVTQKLLNQWVIQELPCCIKNKSLLNQAYRSCLVKALIKSDKRCSACSKKLSEDYLEKLAFLLQSYSCKRLIHQWVTDCKIANQPVFEHIMDRAYLVLLGGFISIVIIVILTTTTLVPTPWVPWVVMALGLSDLFCICCICLPVCSDSFICSYVHCAPCADSELLV